MNNKTKLKQLMLNSLIFRKYIETKVNKFFEKISMHIHRCCV